MTTAPHGRVRTRSCTCTECGLFIPAAQYGARCELCHLSTDALCLYCAGQHAGHHDDNHHHGEPTAEVHRAGQEICR